MAFRLTLPLRAVDGFDAARAPARENLWIMLDGTVSFDQPSPVVTVIRDAHGRVVGQDRSPFGRVAGVIYGTDPVHVDDRLAELLTLAGHSELIEEVDDRSPGPHCPGCGSKAHYPKFVALKAAIVKHGLDSPFTPPLAITVDSKGRPQGDGRHAAIALEDLDLDWRPYARVADGRGWDEALAGIPAPAVPRLDTRPAFIGWTGKLAVALAAAQRALDRLPDPAERRAIRENAGLTQKAVADLVGCSESAVGSWETGVRSPSGPHLRKYVAVLDDLTAAAEAGTSGTDANYATAAGLTDAAPPEVAAAQARLDHATGTSTEDAGRPLHPAVRIPTRRRRALRR